MRILLALALFAAIAHAQTPPTVYEPGNGVGLPRVTKEVKPDNTNEAQAQRIEGTVLLGVVVLNDGSVGDVKVTRSLDSVYRARRARRHGDEAVAVRPRDEGRPAGRRARRGRDEFHAEVAQR